MYPIWVFLYRLCIGNRHQLLFARKKYNIPRRLAIVIACKPGNFTLVVYRKQIQHELIILYDTRFSYEKYCKNTRHKAGNT